MPWTTEEEALYTVTERALADELRTQLNDDVPSKNILDGRDYHYTNSQLIFYLRRAVKDVNHTSPHTNYTMSNFPSDHADILITGGMVFAFMADGILQLRNNIAYDDAGLRVDMFNKSQQYDQKALLFLQLFVQDKKEFKSSILPSSASAGFFGIASPFHPNWGRYGGY